MSDNVLSTFVKRQYVLGKGGVYGHVENGRLVTYNPSDPENNKIWLTDEEAAQKALVGRLTLVDGKVATFTETVAPAPEPPPLVAPIAQSTAPAPTETPVTPKPVAPSPVSTAKRTKIVDWTFVPETVTETLVSLVDDLDDPDDLKAMLAAERTRNNGARARVRQAITARQRQLNMAKARKTRDANLAAKRAEKASSEGDKGGTE